MALTQTLQLAIQAPRMKLTEKSVGVFLKLVPSVSEGTQATHRFFATFLSVVAGIGLLILASSKYLLGTRCLYAYLS
jgi:hypothetical protein